MAKHVVHEYLATRFSGLPLNIVREINRFIDVVGKYEKRARELGVPPKVFHDANRVITNGRWDLEALLYLVVVVYGKWGYEGIKASLHHHLLDY